jgi:hypothetical protein
MKFKHIAILVLIPGLLLPACKDDDKPDVIVDDDSRKNDFGIFYSAYQKGTVYTSDTLYTRFNIVNYGPADLEAGDTLFAGVEVNGVVYNLDLLGADPSALVLGEPVGVNESHEHNSGYLLRTASLNYFMKDTVDLILLTYGREGGTPDLTFPKDPKPANNKAVLRLTRDNHFIVE